MDRVCIAVACSEKQFPTWWAALATRMLQWNALPDVEINLVTVGQSALPDHNHNAVVREWLGKKAFLTSYNRNAIVAQATARGAEWIFQIDDDTIPPRDALSKLLARQRPFVAGIYYQAGYPFTPVAYYRTESGRYYFVRDFERGSLLEVDAVGMGCTLIHAEVFGAILENFRRYQRPDGSEVLIHKDDVHDKGLPRGFRGHTALYGDTLVMPVSPMEQADRFAFPYYAMEHGRTEDFHFCELAARVGYKPLLDTSIVCEHIKTWALDDEAFFRVRNEKLIAGEGLETMEYGAEKQEEAT